MKKNSNNKNINACFKEKKIRTTASYIFKYMYM